MLDVLIVEDDAASRQGLAEWFESHGLACRAAPDLATARGYIEERSPDFALLDLELPDGSGLELLQELGAAHDTDVVMASGRGTLDAAIDALRLGARDFLTKPVEMSRLEAIVRSAVHAAELRAEVQELRGKLKSFGRFGDMIGSSEPMRATYDLIEAVASSNETVLITGETGTGKEVTAATIHKLSRRGTKPFVAVNCGAVSPNLMESEFFGHERGAFTGAQKRHKGVFERAHGGTLFLDEITEMPVDLQVKLLRVLETGQVTRLGGSEAISVDARIVAATNRDPEQAVEDGLLRQDLLYRLLVFPVHLPRLAERGEDIVELANAFLAELNEESDTRKLLSDSAADALRAHDWPGNVRELRNVLRRAYLLSETHVEAEHLPFEAPKGGSSSATPTATSSESTSSDDTGNSRLLLRPGMSVAEAEKRLIQATLEHCEGRKKEAVEHLGISLKTLYARLKVYAVQDESQD